MKNNYISINHNLTAFNRNLSSLPLDKSVRNRVIKRSLFFLCFVHRLHNAFHCATNLLLFLLPLYIVQFSEDSILYIWSTGFYSFLFVQLKMVMPLKLQRISVTIASLWHDSVRGPMRKIDSDCVDIPFSSERMEDHVQTSPLKASI